MQPNWWYNFVGLVIARFPPKRLDTSHKDLNFKLHFDKLGHWSWLCFHLFPHTWCYSNHTRAYHIPYLGVECLSVWQEPAFMVMQPFSDFPSVPEFARLIKSTPNFRGDLVLACPTDHEWMLFCKKRRDDTPQLFLLVTCRTDDYITYVVSHIW